MGSRRRTTGHHDDAEVDIRNEEVLRANRELAAYFKGKRTEREARAALKIIKAFIRYREKIAPSKRLPLPGASKGDRAVRPIKRPSLTVVAEGE
ncbi:MAG TPA: hypothetical protein VF456_24940 [Vicinamibacterales bacterium]